MANMKLDLVQEGITTNFNSQEIIRIMEDENLNSDAKCRRLFNRGEDYLSHVQWLCFRKSEGWIQYLFDHNFVTPDFRSSWEENRNEAWNRLDEVVDTAEEINNPSGKRTLFLDNRQWPEEEPCTLEQSWDVYVVRGESRGSNKETRAEYWFTHIKSSVSYIEDHGITQETPKKRLGFFDENLNESISRNFTTDDQIREIMENEQLSLEQKSERLFNRSPEHVRMFAMCTFQIPREVWNYADEHGGSLYHVDTSPIRAVSYDYSVGGATLMVLGNMSEPFDLEESYEYYVLGNSEKYGRTNDYTMEPLGWWKYIKACVEVFETAAGYKGKRLGFFDESLEDGNPTREELEDILENNDDENACKILFNRDKKHVYTTNAYVMLLEQFINKFISYDWSRERILNNYRQLGIEIFPSFEKYFTEADEDELKKVARELQRLNVKDYKWGILYGSGEEEPLHLNKALNDCGRDNVVYLWKSVKNQMEYIEAKGWVTRQKKLGFFDV